jgi:hypothetical protein
VTANGDEGRAVTYDASGNIYTIGQYVGTADFDPGPGVTTYTSPTNYNMFIQKLDASGNFVWARAFGNLHTTGNSVFVDGVGNVYCTGYFSGTVDFDPGVGTFSLTSVGTGVDLFLLKLDASGNFLWCKQVTSTTKVGGWGIAMDGTGNILLAVTMGGTADLDPGPGVFNLTAVATFDLAVLKLDNSGNFIWAKQFASTGGGNYVRGVVTDATGNVYTTGYFSGNCDFDPGPGTYYINAGTTYNIFLSKLDASGNFIWAKGFGTTTVFGEGHSIGLDGSGNIVISGFFDGTIDFDAGASTYNLTSAGNSDIFIEKLDQSGNFLWAKQIGGSGIDKGASLAVDGASNIYLTGIFQGTVDFDPGPSTHNLSAASSIDRFIQKLDPNGLFAWVEQFSNSVNNFTNVGGICVDGGGTIYATAAFTGTADFDPSPSVFNLTSQGGTDIFVLKLTQCTVTPLQPGAINGSTSACSGSSQTYSVPAVTGATSYTWTLPPGWTGTSTTSSITATAGITGGNITVVAVNGCGTSPTQTLSVTVSPGPSATITAVGATSFCQGGSVTLVATTGTGLTYQWKLNGNNITGATSASYTANASGAYTLVVTSSSCSATSTATNVTVNPLPTPTITQAGNLLTAPAGFAAYQWYKNSTLIPGATLSTYTALSSGSYHVIVTNANNCSGQSNTIGLTVGIDDVSNSLVHIYPNPNEGEFYIDHSRQAGVPDVRAFNVLGQEVPVETTKQGQGKLKISIANRLTGVYYLQLTFPAEVINTSIQIR